MCTKEGCDKGARGASEHCIAHGGGKRCTKEGCDKGAQGASEHCAAHGGGKRCTKEGCDKGAQGASAHCAAHGGGTRCSGCNMTSVRVKGDLCSVCSPCSSPDATMYGLKNRLTLMLLKEAGLQSLSEEYFERGPCDEGNKQKFGRSDATFTHQGTISFPKNWVVVMETNEHEHESNQPECDMARHMAHVSQLVQKYPECAILHLLFNPDKGHTYSDSTKENLKEKLSILIQNQITLFRAIDYLRTLSFKTGTATAIFINYTEKSLLKYSPLVEKAQINKLVIVDEELPGINESDICNALVSEEPSKKRAKPAPSSSVSSSSSAVAFSVSLADLMMNFSLEAVEKFKQAGATRAQKRSMAALPDKYEQTGTVLTAKVSKKWQKAAEKYPEMLLSSFKSYDGSEQSPDVDAVLCLGATENRVGVRKDNGTWTCCRNGMKTPFHHVVKVSSMLSATEGVVDE